MGERKLTAAGQKRKEINHLRSILKRTLDEILYETPKIREDLGYLVTRVETLYNSLNNYYTTKNELEKLTTKQRKPK